MNGVQCSYTTSQISSGATTLGVDGQKLSFANALSPIFSSPNDSPVRHRFEIATDDSVRVVRVRAGDLVDSIEFVTERGMRVSYGGSGGQLHEVLINQTLYNGIALDSTLAVMCDSFVVCCLLDETD